MLGTSLQGLPTFTDLGSQRLAPLYTSGSVLRFSLHHTAQVATTWPLPSPSPVCLTSPTALPRTLLFHLPPFSPAGNQGKLPERDLVNFPSASWITPPQPCFPARVHPKSLHSSVTCASAGGLHDFAGWAKCCCRGSGMTPPWYRGPGGPCDGGAHR